jgi:hypothetical protein
VTLSEQELDDRLSVVTSQAPSTQLQHSLDTLVAWTSIAATRSRTIRLRLAVGALALGALGGVAAVPAAADAIHEFLAQSDFVPDTPPQVTDSQMVDLGAPDLRAYVETIYPEWLPLSLGQSRSALLDRLVAERANGVAGTNQEFVQEVFLRRDLERYAYCGWVDTWLGELDPARRILATAEIGRAARWPATVATAVQGVLPMMDAFARAAAAGDGDGVQFAAERFGCAAWDGSNRSWWAVGKNLQPLEDQTSW